jgi:hypothetical protein
MVAWQRGNQLWEAEIPRGLLMLKAPYWASCKTKAPRPEKQAAV